ncbi:NUDIX hydrolase [Reyranella sp.]|uniref:NUDIX hydrolase n=1 Tax=Reyranella sp. TaxID=1929291 RepID=UPI003BA84B44
MPPGPRPVAVELNAVLIALIAEQPQVLTLEDGALLPSGPFETDHPTLQTGLRAWVERQTHHPLGYVEQLYTFADRYRESTQGYRIVSISYLGLTRERAEAGQHEPGWQNIYRYFPWEDWRDGPPRLLTRALLPRLKAWVDAASDTVRRDRRQRVDGNFDLAGWNEEQVLQRYELLYEAGLVPEAGTRARKRVADPIPGEPMHYDHRRILATGLARLRAKIKYRPVVFELMPRDFTLGQLQRAVEALAGRSLHKQNFRRLIEQQGLVEETGAMTSGTGGRPAKLFRFRREIVAERAVAGSKLPLSRS